MRFPRGARPSPRHKLASATPLVARAAVPGRLLVLPSKLSYWDNERDGDCVSAGEAMAKAVWSIMAGYPELFIADAVLVEWARSHDFLDGAVITDVLDAMIRDGIVVDGVKYTDGPYRSVDWTSDATLRTAIAAGPVKLGVAAAQLEAVPGIGGRNGWFAAGFARDTNQDHDTELCGYGTVGDLVELFNAVEPASKLAVPHGVDPAEPAYAMFTWDGVGIILRPSLLAITGEAWLRTPTTPEQPAVSPPAPPIPVPVTPPPPGPTPPPEPGPVDLVVTVDLSRHTFAAPPGWGRRLSMTPAITIHPKIQQVDAPAGYTEA